MNKFFLSNHSIFLMINSEKCHAKVLQTCGVAVIEGFGIADLSLEEKCSIRQVRTWRFQSNSINFNQFNFNSSQDFLECMIRLDKHSCSSRNVRDMDDKWINALRQQILQVNSFIAIESSQIQLVNSLSN